jgi:diguanylate cyclase (GGDEF)-like protein/PAS domain S-box-containing protein
MSRSPVRRRRPSYPAKATASSSGDPDRRLTVSGFEVVAEEAPSIIWAADREGVIHYLNRIGREYLGGSLESSPGRLGIERIHPDDAENARRIRLIAGEANAPYAIQERLRRHDGEYRWHAVQALPWRQQGGQVTGWICTVTDIEQQKQVEQDLLTAQRATAETLTILDTLQRNAPVGFGFMDRDFRMQRMNEKLAAIDGGTVEAFLGRKVSEVVPKLWPTLEPIYRRVLVTGQAALEVEVGGETAAAPGQVRNWVTSIYPVRVDDEIIGLGIVVIDITNRKAAEEAMRLSAELAHQQSLVSRASAERDASYRSLFDENPQPMFVSNQDAYPVGDGRGEFLSVNKAALELYGYARDEFLSLSPIDLRAEDSQGRLPADLVAVLNGRLHFENIRHRTKCGEVIDVEIDIRQTAFDGRSAKIVCIRDVTRRVLLQSQLEHQAFHDLLTGLPNRSLFNDRLAHADQRQQRSVGRYAVLMLDVDNFKTVNDSLGHGAGDALLVDVAKRLTSTMRPGDTTARLGGDEFAILLEDLVDDAGAVAAADRLRGALREPFSVGGRVLTVTATVGVALSTGMDVPSDVVRNADVALYVGKAAGKNRHDVFSEHMHAAAVERLTLEQDLREGIGRGELMLLYQPKVDAKSGLLCGVEALVRWNHPTRGLIGPDAFIPLAEQSGLIAELDHWVLREACRQARAWSISGTGPIPVAINVSGKNLLAKRLLTQVQETLAETALDPRLLELEITESAAIPHDTATMRRLQRIRDLGVRIAIDDFGTGFSVLSMLEGFPLDTLKIDLTFVRMIAKAGDEAPIVDAMIAMGNSLGLIVVAEGVETQVQRDYLTTRGCSQLQGYLFSRPIGADHLAAWMKSSHTVSG